jgi:hypothetical protein
VTRKGEGGKESKRFRLNVQRCCEHNVSFDAHGSSFHFPNREEKRAEESGENKRIE